MSFEDLKGKLTGQPALIMGNGWSVNLFPSSLYSKFFTIGVNRIYKYHQVDAWVCPDLREGVMFETAEDCLSSIESKIRVCSTRHMGVKCATHVVKCSTPDKIKDPGPEALYSVGSSVFMSIGLAAVMGCETIVVIGCDGDSKNYPYHFFGEHPDKDRIKHDVECNTDGWNKTIELADKEGIEIYNCSPISQFDMIPKAQLTDFL